MTTIIPPDTLAAVAETRVKIRELGRHLGAVNSTLDEGQKYALIEELRRLEYAAVDARGQIRFTYDEIMGTPTDSVTTDSPLAT